MQLGLYMLEAQVPGDTFAWLAAVDVLLCNDNMSMHEACSVSYCTMQHHPSSDPNQAVQLVMRVQAALTLHPI